MGSGIRRGIILKAAAIVFGILGAWSSSTLASTPVPVASTSVAVAKTQPLRDLAKAQPIAPLGSVGKETFPPLPIPDRGEKFKGPVPVIADPVVQSNLPLDAKMPAPAVNFDGMGNTSGVLPPDTVGDVGPNHYVQMVNLTYQVWDKSGNSLVGPLASNTIWSALPANNICRTNNDGDPIVLYDQAADRWLLSQFALDTSGTNGFHQCIAISTSNDPTGSFYLYDFKISDTKMNDYPHFGIWPDGYYLAVNQFVPPTYSWGGQGVVAFERSKMLQGLAAQQVYFDDPDPSLGGMLPADWDGAQPPAAGAPALFLQLGGDSASLDIWAFHVDWTTPSNSTFTPLSSPTVAAFDNDLCGGSRNCIAQPSGTALDSLAGRLMHRVQYRRFNSYEALVTNHTVDANGSDQAGVRWYELRNTGTGWSVANQGTYAPDGDHRWMGSAAMDAQGNIAIGYSVTGTTTYPSVRYAGRLVGDPANTLPQAEATLVAGGGAQSSTSGRWGDYSSMNVDPVDDCTFWYTQEYYATSSDAGWKTRIGSFKYPGCTSGPAGSISGVVTTNTPSPGTPVQGALVDLGGLTTVTDASGAYSMASVPVGTYTLTVSAWGYNTETVNNVQIQDGVTTTQDVVLTQAPMAVVSGTVKDGGAHGWPLYAAIDISGAPLDTIFTDPVTGAYSVSLPEGSNVTINVSVDGYVSQARSVVVPAGPSIEDFSMLADETSCDAPGYEFTGFYERFEDVQFPPAGWTVENALAGNPNSITWNTNVFYGDDNLTGGAGMSATVNSDQAGASAVYDTSLISPVFPTAGNASLSFLADYNNYVSTDFVDLDISVDGGTTWTNVLRWNEDHSAELVTLDLSAYFGAATSYQLRWRYYDTAGGGWNWWIQIDDVKVGTVTCAADPGVGAMLVGNVYDGNTGMPVNGATVSAAGNSAETVSTPDDANLDDGFYRLPVPAGVNQSVTATAARYGTVTQVVHATASEAMRQDLDLPAGLLSATPAPLTLTMWEGMTWTKTLDLVNNGSHLANYELREYNMPYVAPHANGPWAEQVRHMSPKGLNQGTAEGIRYYNPPAPQPLGAGDVLRSWDTGLASAWGLAIDKDTGLVWVGNSWWDGGDGVDYSYSVDGTATGDGISTLSWSLGGSGPVDMAYDVNNRTLWQVDVGHGNCIHEMDPASLSVTGSSICPPFGTSMRGLAYDPVTDTFYAGSWNDSTIHHFDRTGNILDSKDVGLSVSGLAYNPDTQHLFVMQSALLTATEIYVLDVTNSYAVVGSMEVAFSADYSGAGLGIACDGRLWAVDQQNEKVLEIDSGETSACAWSNIDWLSENPVSGVVAASSNQSVDFVFDSTSLTPGTYEAHVKLNNDTPYGLVPLSVVFDVVPYTQMFADVDPTHMFYHYVQSIGFAGITTGCDTATPLPNYCEGNTVSRAHMAVFLGRAIHGSNHTPPPATGTVFNDVSGSYWAAPWIEEFVADGMTSGCDANGNYCPETPVDRGQMAVFLLKAKYGADYVPPSATGTVFADVDTNYWSADWIEKLAADGITLGCDASNYCPNAPVERGQMAVFLQRTFNLPIHP